MSSPPRVGMRMVRYHGWEETAEMISDALQNRFWKKWIMALKATEARPAVNPMRTARSVSRMCSVNSLLLKSIFILYSKTITLNYS